MSKYGRQLLDEELRERGLGLKQHAVLSALSDFGPLSQQELADSLDIHKSHLVRPIYDLEQRGLVQRSRDASDRRRNQVAITPAGTTVVDEVQDVARRSQQGFLDALSAAEQRTLVALLARVLDANDTARADRARRGRSAASPLVHVGFTRRFR